VKEPLPENLLMKADKTTMPFSIEGRVPFLDHKLAEFAATIPPHLKLNKIKNEKYILKEAMRPYLPESIIRRKKHRFYVPIDLWMQKEDIKGMFDKVLNKQEVNRQGFFDYSTIDKIQKNYQTSPLFYARQLWTLLNFQIWHKMFIEEDAIKTGKLPKIF
jgi:asparagine synthase (glutamine-hydrolysing)